MLSEQLSSRPESVRWAVYFALLAFAVALVNTYRLGPQVSSRMNPALLWSYTVATSALWLLLVFLVFRGRNWARIVFCVLALLSLPGTLFINLFRVADAAARFVSGSQALLNITAAVLLLIPSSTHWYREVRTASRDGAA